MLLYLYPLLLISILIVLVGTLIGVIIFRDIVVPVLWAVLKALGKALYFLFRIPDRMFIFLIFPLFRQDTYRSISRNANNVYTGVRGFFNWIQRTVFHEEGSQPGALARIGFWQFCLGWLKDIKLSILGIVLAGGLFVTLSSLLVGHDVIPLLVLGFLLGLLQMAYMKQICGIHKERSQNIVSLVEMTLCNIFLLLLVVVLLVIFLVPQGLRKESGVADYFIYVLFLGSAVSLFTLCLPYTASRAREVGKFLDQWKYFGRHSWHALKTASLLKLVGATVVVYLFSPFTWYVLWTYHVADAAAHEIMVWGHLIPPILCLAWGSAKIAATCPEHVPEPSDPEEAT